MNYSDASIASSSAGPKFFYVASNSRWMSWAVKKFEENDFDVTELDRNLALQLEAKDTRGARFLIDSFDNSNPVFAHLKSINAKIMSPQFARYCIENENMLRAAANLAPNDDRLPSKFDKPLFSCAMKGVEACCSNVDIGLREDIMEKVQYMGGLFSKSFYETTTHLIAVEVGSTKYKHAAKMKLKIVSPDWVQAAWKLVTAKEYDENTCSKILNFAATDDAFINQYLVPPLKGAIITFTGLGEEDRVRYKKAVEDNGGTYTGNMQQGICTHLIAVNQESTKYKMARKWNIFVVSVDWLTESIRSGYCADAKEFPVRKQQTSTPTRPSARKDLDVDCSVIPRDGAGEANWSVLTESGISMAGVTHVDETRLGGSDGASSSTTSSSSSCLHPNSARAPRQRNAKQSTGPGAGMMGPPSEVPSRRTTRGAVAGGKRTNQSPSGSNNTGSDQTDDTLANFNCTGVTLTGANVNPVTPLDELDLTRTTSGDFLDNCHIFFNGYSGIELEKLKRLVNAGGGIRVTSLTSSVTHVICLKSPPPLSLLDDLTRALLTPHLVTHRWLVASFKAGKGVAPEPYLVHNWGHTGDGADIHTPTSSVPAKRMRSSGSDDADERHSGAETVVRSKKTVSKTAGGNSERTIQATTSHEEEDDVLSQYLEAIPTEIMDQPNAGTSSEQQPAADLNSNAAALAAAGHNFDPEATTMEPEDMFGDPQVMDQVDGDDASAWWKSLRFNICGFDELPEEIAEMTDLIQQHGGTVLVDSDAVDYSIWPLMSTNEPPLPGTTMKLVTKVWLYVCIERAGLVPADDSLYFRPIFVSPSILANPEAGQPGLLSGAVICITQVQGLLRDAIGHVADTMGGVVQEFFIRKAKTHEGVWLKKNTHLIALEPEGKKYDAAIKWNIPAVKPNWLVDCATRGEVLPESHYSVIEDDESDAVPPAENPAPTGHPTVPPEESAINTPVRPPVTRTERRREPDETNTTCLAATHPPAPVESAADVVTRNPREEVETAVVQKRNLIEQPVVVNQRVHALRRSSIAPPPAPSSSSGEGSPMDTESPSVTPSKFLDPDRSFHPRFNMNSMLAGLQTPEGEQSGENVLSPSMSEKIKRGIDKVNAKYDRTGGRKSSSDAAEGTSTPITSKRSTRLQPNNDNLEANGANNKRQITTPGATPRHLGPLAGVVIVVSKKLISKQQTLHKQAVNLGADYRWKFETSCTHFIFEGKEKDTARDFQTARRHNKIIVSPHWIDACERQRWKVDESSYPHTYNPNMPLLDVVKRPSLTKTQPPQNVPTTTRSTRNSPQQQQQQPQATALPPTTAMEVDQQSTSGRSSRTSRSHGDGQRKAVSPARTDISSADSGVGTNAGTDNEAQQQDANRRSSEDARRSEGVSLIAPSQPAAESNTGGANSRAVPARSQVSSAPTAPVVAPQETLPESLEIRNAFPDDIDNILNAAKVSAGNRASRNSVSARPSSRPGHATPTLSRLASASSNMESPSSGGRKSTKRVVEGSAAAINWEDPSEKKNKAKLSTVIRSDNQPTQQSTEVDFDLGDTDLAEIAETRVEGDATTSQQYKFMFTSLGDDDDAYTRYVSIVESLGATFLSSQFYNPECTHLIMGKPARNEKALACIASGVWVLQTTYLDACQRAKNFVQEEPYEWNADHVSEDDHDMSTSDLAMKLAAAPRRWRLKRQESCTADSFEGHGAFFNWHILLFAAPKKIACFKRLLEAGGAEIYDFKSLANNFEGITHVLMDEGMIGKGVTKSQLRKMHNKGIPIAKLDYIPEHLAEEDAVIDSYLVDFEGKSS